jgi:hypothetical protein
LEAKYLFVLCAGFTLLLGEDTLTSSLYGALVRSVTKLASITFLSLVHSPTGSIYLGFITEGRLAAVLITPSLGVPNWSVIYINTAPSTTPELISVLVSSRDFVSMFNFYQYNPPDCPRSVYRVFVMFLFRSVSVRGLFSVLEASWLPQAMTRARSL